MHKVALQYSITMGIVPCSFGQNTANLVEVNVNKSTQSLLSPPAITHATTGAGDVRIGPLAALPIILCEMGVDPLHAFAEAGIEPCVFDNPENRVPLEILGTLLASCVTLTNCQHFGLLVGERFEIHHFGLLGELLSHSATVGEAIRHLILNLHLNDRGAAPVLLYPEPGRVFLGYSVYRHGTPAADQIQDVAITVGYRILQALCGSHWKPISVQFAHNPPMSITPYRRIFQSTIRFEAEVSGIELAASWLDKAIVGADKARHDLIYTTIQEQASGVLSFAEQVEAALPQMLLSGTATSEGVACLFDIHERTLRRRLESEGQNLQQLINTTRFELAKQMLHNTRLSVSMIAKVLRYDDPTAFSRAFRSWASLSPKQWREQQSSVNPQGF